jgi:hypothetical protein
VLGIHYWARMARRPRTQVERDEAPEQDPDRAPRGYRVYGAARTPKFHLVTESSIEAEDWTAICGQPVGPGRRSRVWGEGDTYCHECATLARA